MDEARRLFDRIIETQLQEGKLLSVPFNIMMYKYAHMGDMFSFNALITQMLDLGMKLDEDTYVHIIRAYIRWNDPETAFEYYRKMLSQGISQTLHSYHIVIDLFAKMNNENGMMEVIRTMITKGIMPNEHTLALLVGYYVNLGKVEEARKVQDLFKKSFPHISGYMRCHNIIINHYAKLENRAGVLKEVHRATAVFGAILDINSYTCMVKLFALSDIKAARKIFELALEKCRHGLDGEIFATMIEASYNAGDYDSAIEIYNRMNALDIVPDQKIIKLCSRLKATGR
jgi:pentatricopeptide repeat protein